MVEEVSERMSELTGQSGESRGLRSCRGSQSWQIKEISQVMVEN